MNILIANTQEFNPQIGGVERVSTILAEEFQQLGHLVYFLACQKSTYSKEYTPVVKQFFLSDALQHASPNNIEEFYGILNEFKIDIIINQAGNMKAFSSLCFKAAERNKHVKIISVIHIDPIYKFRSLFDLSSSILSSKKNYKIWLRLLLLPYRLLMTYIDDRNLYNFIYRKSDFVSLLSNQFLKDFKKITGLTSCTKLTAISNPFPYQINSHEREIEKENKILYVGRIDYDHKRVDRLLDMWSKISLDFPTWSIDIVGDGPIKQELVNLVKVKKIERVNFINFSDPIKYYMSSSILCMTSTFEGLPMVLIEASKFGCIPVAFKSFASLSDIINNGKDGYIIKSFNLTTYENTLRLLMKNNELRKTIQMETVKIPKKFQTKIIVEQWIKLFDELYV